MKDLSDKLVVFVLYVFMVVVAAWVLIPYFWMFSASLSELQDLFKWPPNIFPWPIHPSNFVLVWGDIQRFFFNSIIASVLPTFAHLFFDSLAGFVFAKMKFPGKEPLFLAVLATMMLPFEVRVLPLFIMTRMMNWINTYESLIFPFIMGAFGIFLFRQFITPIPDELIEAARIDGCSYFRIYWSIIMPLCRAPLMALAIFTFLWRWNDFFWPLIVTNTFDMRTLPVGLTLAFQDLYGSQWNLLMAAAVIAFLPGVLLFVFLQRYVMAGAVLSGVKR